MCFACALYGRLAGPGNGAPLRSGAPQRFFASGGDDSDFAATARDVEGKEKEDAPQHGTDSDNPYWQPAEAGAADPDVRRPRRGKAG